MQILKNNFIELIKERPRSPIMNKIRSAIQFIFGENENYSLEQRLFISALIIGILLGFAGTLTNFILITENEAIIIPSILSFVLVIFFYLVRFKGLFKILVLPIIIFSYLGLAVIWYFNGGMDGSNEFIFIVAFILGLLIVEQNQKIYLFIFYVILKTALYLLQLYRPELIIGFPSVKARWLDIFFTSIYVSFIIYLIINFLHKNYTKERLTVEDSKKELQELNLELNESNNTKDLFFSIISHDLKSPFNSIIGLSDLLVRNVNTYDREKFQLLAKNINKSANETYLLLENLLKWSRLQRGIIIPDYGKYNLSKMISELGILYRESAKTKEIIINENVSEDIFVYCDEEIVKTVLRNLIANSIKFTEPKGFIYVSANENNGLVEIQITDTGVGIANEKIPELFSIDKNNSTKGTANEKGTGLGLHLCKALIEKHGGEMWVESDIGKGSSFYFTVKKFIDGEKANAIIFKN